MAMTEYNPPKEPWIDVIYEDEHIIAANKPLVCYLFLGDC